tara:strand:- start:418 stop:2487 length:2070 start_codon:yes stop_codon:yes gene_type:complete
MNLFIVESPAKIKTIRKFLGKDFEIRASMGHVREIPKKGLGVNVSKGFKAQFELIESKSRNTKELLNLMKRAQTVYFAQDLDREGELIAWHLYDESQIEPEKVKRVVFNEITKKAVLDAISTPRELNQSLIDAGMSRTILDRLIGYKLSPLVWNRFESDVPLSVGRVQTVALRILVDREREIDKFVKEEFWNLKANFREGFSAEIVLSRDKKLDAQTAEKLQQQMTPPNAIVKGTQSKTEKRKPRAPFTTATLQQEASSKLRFSAKETMKIAQELYEGVPIENENRALITYMRTDAVNLSNEATDKIREFIRGAYGVGYLPSKEVKYKGKTKNAQEAHEAIRPVYFDLPPHRVRSYLKPKQYDLYCLIWNKAIACQMKPAEFDSTVVDIDINGVHFRVKGSILRFDGFLRLYDDRDLESEKESSAKGKSGPNSQKEIRLPSLEEGQKLEVEKIISEKKFTKPSPRYTEASLVKYLEKNGIGRPSTYASIIETLLKRGYTELKSRKFHVTSLGKQLLDWIAQNFQRVIDLKFTAMVEASLDEVARGELSWRDSVEQFYQPLREQIVNLQGFVEEELSEDQKKCPECDSELLVRSGKYGQFMGCSGFPECNFILKIGRKSSIRVRSSGLPTGIYCEICGGEFHLRRSNKGKVFECSNYPACHNKKTHLTQDEYATFKKVIKKHKQSSATQS